MEEANDIGQRIRKLRTDLGMKQADFVAALDISRSYLSKIESGTEQPGRELLLKIAQEYNLTFDWLLSGVGNRTPLYPLNDQEIQLLQAFRALPREEAETHLKLMLQRSGSKIG
ncbi:MAG: helix-turn-helix transcriptional regulator [Gluconobacter oxydans]